MLLLRNSNVGKPSNELQLIFESWVILKFFHKRCDVPQEYLYFCQRRIQMVGPGAQAWWEAPCADTRYLDRGWFMKSLVFPHIIDIYDVILLRYIF